MGIIVSKFGGSSTANASNLKRVASLVRSAPSRRCVVLSAPGIDGKHREKVTAMLDRCWDNRKQTAAFEGAVSAVAERYREICAGLGIPDDASVIGFDGLYLGDMCQPSLSTVQQDMCQMGREAARMLHGLLMGSGVGGHYMLPHRLILRGSFRERNGAG